MKVINLTPHAISLANANGEIISIIEPSGSVARVETTQINLGEAAGVPITKTIFGDPVGLPEARQDTILLTSTIVAQAVQRVDVVSPLTDKTAIRNAAGQVIAVRGFQTF